MVDRIDMTLSFLVCGAFDTPYFSFVSRRALPCFRLVAERVWMHGAFDGLDYAAETDVQSNEMK